MHFIINNITSMNIEQKAKELKGIVAREHWPWFANYLVVKRAAQVRASRRSPAYPSAWPAHLAPPCAAPTS